MKERADGVTPVVVPAAVAEVIDMAVLPMAGESPRLAYDDEDDDEEEEIEEDRAVGALAALNEYVGCGASANDDADPIGGDRSESAPYEDAEAAEGRAVTDRVGTELVVVVAVVFAFVLERLPPRADMAAAAPVKETVRELMTNEQRRNSWKRENYGDGMAEKNFLDTLVQS